MSTEEEIKKLTKEVEGFKNAIWAYKFEFHDLPEEQRNSTIEKFTEKIRIKELEIEATKLAAELEDELGDE